ncbi:hypothetical protein ABZ342_16855 [Amycolatopsis sp. NPDC005961]|uniref:hypothetical protein n=1 Tax=Amycolatopsis sp. NPDC005961 TaxID=3156720 RepID=UPI0033C6FDA0
MPAVTSSTASRPETVHGPSGLVRAGLALAAVGALVVVALDVFPAATPWNPLRDTVSQAQWGSGLFRPAVASVAAGSAAALTHARRGGDGPRSCLPLDGPAAHRSGGPVVPRPYRHAQGAPTLESDVGLEPVTSPGPRGRRDGNFRR